MIKVLTAIYQAILIIGALMSTSLTIFYVLQNAKGIDTGYKIIAAVISATAWIALPLLEDT